MQKSLVIVILVGTALGAMLPTSRHDAPAQAKTSSSEEAGETLLEREDNGHFYADATVNGELVRFVVDTGATSIALTVADAERLGVPFSRGDFKVVGRGASGPVRGQLVTLDAVEIDGKLVTEVDGAVLEGLDISLLGQSYLSRISGVEMSGDYMTLR